MAGSSANGSNFDYGFARLNANGSLDLSFSSVFIGPQIVDGGRSAIAVGQGNDYGTSAVALPDGRMIVAGRVLTGSGQDLAFSGSDDDFGLIRLNVNGSLDTRQVTSRAEQDASTARQGALF